MEIQKELEKSYQLSLEQRKEIYQFAHNVSKDTINEVCPFILRVLLNEGQGKLKNELGRVIFHLQKNERLNTKIGLEKLIDAALLVAPDELFKILNSSDEDAKNLAANIRSVLQG